jgi:hypothetical protein
MILMTWVLTFLMPGVKATVYDATFDDLRSCMDVVVQLNRVLEVAGIWGCEVLR